MTHPDTIKALRDALLDLYTMTSRYAIADADYGFVRNAWSALALTADASEDAPFDKAMKAARFVYRGMPMAIQALDYLQAHIDNPLPSMEPAARPAPVAATPAPADLDLADERKRFEEWAGNPPVEIEGIDADPTSFWCWSAWQAALGLSPSVRGPAAAPAAPIAPEVSRQAPEVSNEGPEVAEHAKPEAVNVSAMPVQPLCNSVPVAHTKLAKVASDALFEKWWEEHGQFCRAGGGDYEKTFAYRAWQARGQQAGAVDRRQTKQPVEIERRSGFEWRETNGGQ